MDILELIMLIFFIATIVIVVRLNKKVDKGQTNNNKLTTSEKIFTIFAGIIIPLLAVNGIMYYGLRKKYPIKAKQANNIGWIVLVIGIALNVLLRSLSG